MILLWIVIGLVLIFCVALALAFIGAGIGEQNDNEVEEMLNGKQQPE